MSECNPAGLSRGIRFRKAGSVDIGVLAGLNLKLIRDEQHRNSMTLVELEQRMAGFLSTDYEATLFETDDDVVGFALYRAEPAHLYLRQFYVREDCRRRGIGRAAMLWLQENEWRGHSRIRLDVLTTNSAALAFWRAVGFHDYCVTMEFERDAATR